MVGYKEGHKVTFKRRKLETPSKQASALETSTHSPTDSLHLLIDMSKKDTEVESSADRARCLEQHVLTPWKSRMDV